MDYMDTIKRGFSLTCNNKFMWVLGFLAALGSGSAFSNSNYSTNSSDMAGMADWMTPERMAALSAGLIAFSCVAVILGLVLWLVALSARGRLIAGAVQLDRGQTKPTFRSAFGMGWRKVWRLAGMTLLLFAVPTILFILLVIGFIVLAGGAALMASGMDDPSAFGAGIGGVALVFLCLMCLLVPFTLVLTLIYPFAFRGMVLRDLGAMDSIRHGWRTLRENLGEIILLGLAFFLINIVIIVISVAIIVPIGLAVGVPMAMLSGSNASAIQGILAVLGIIVGLVIFALISAITTAWQSSTFTLAYLQWTGKDVIVE